MKGSSRFFKPHVQSLEDRRLLTGTLTGRVWFDTNFNGQQDAAETQNASVTVTIVQSLMVKGQATTVNGIYTINNVPSGQTYDVVFSLPTGMTLGPTDSGNDTTDNDFGANQTSGATSATVRLLPLTDGQTVDLDAGLVQGATLTTFVWNDVDGDGIQDAGAEATGLGNVDLTLGSTGGEGYAAFPLKSPDNGIVTFTNVRPGRFKLTYSHGTFKPTLRDQGTNDTIDSDIDQPTGNSPNFTLTPGPPLTDVDAGFRDPALVSGTISGRAWLDNGDGIRQTTETTLSGTQTFDLYRSTDDTVGNADDLFVTSAATNALQEYKLAGVAPGKYFVRSSVPTNHVLTLQNQGTNDAIDSDFLPSTRNSGLLVVTAGVTIPNVDVGYIAGTASIGNFIWNDIDRDGIQDATEPGLAGAVVKLFNSANLQVGTSVTTTSTGAYLFSGLQPGQYTVRVTPPLGYIPTLKDQGLDDTKDSDLDRTTLSTAVITVAANTAATQWDAGMYLGATIGDRVWLDTDFDGVQDVGELGKQGVEVRLKSLGADGNAGTADDVQLAQTSTDVNGLYKFVAVDNGVYYVQFTAPTSFAFTKRDIGTDTLDSDAGLSNGRTAKIVIANLASNSTIDAGLVPTGSVHVDLGRDDNNDGLLDPGLNVANIDVYLYDPGNGVVGDDDDVLVATAKSNSLGDVDFPKLRPVKYYVRVSLPEGYRFSSPNVGTNEAIDSDITHFCDGYGLTDVFLLSTTVVSTITVGLQQIPGSIEGVVWNDVNSNKVRDGGLVKGTPPDVILAIDVSGSTSEPFAGFSTGDVNGDGFADTILDAEILAGASLVQQLINAGYGATARIGIVTFNGTARQLDMNPVLAGVQLFATPSANANANASLDIVETLQSIRSGGATNYEAALQMANSTVTSMATLAGRGNVLFFSDGVSTQGGSFSDEVATLKSKGVNLKAFGVGAAASLSQLQIIDPQAKTYASTDDFFAAFQLTNNTSFATERGMAGVEVYLDLDDNKAWDPGVEPLVLSRDDDPDTSAVDETGLFRFNSVAAGSYIVRERIPTGYTQTSPGVSGGLGWLANVTPGKTVKNVDFGNLVSTTLTSISVAPVYAAGTDQKLLAPTAVVSDVDKPIWNGRELSIRLATNQPTTDQLFISPQGNQAGKVGVAGKSVLYGGVVIASWTGGSGGTALKITFNASATVQAVQAVVKRIAFRSTLATPSLENRTVTWKMTDGLGGHMIKTQTLSVVT